MSAPGSVQPPAVEKLEPDPFSLGDGDKTTAFMHACHRSMSASIKQGWEPIDLGDALKQSEAHNLRMLYRCGSDPHIEDYATTHGAAPEIRIEEYRDGRVMAYRRKAEPT